MYWYCVIFFAILFVAMIFFYEETKYSKPLLNARIPSQEPFVGNRPDSANKKDDLKEAATRQSTKTSLAHGEGASNDWIDHTIPLKSYRERHRLFTTTPGTLGQFLEQTFRPFVYLYSFPAVAYTSIQFGSMLALFSVIGNSQAAIFSLPPYNFSVIGIGLISIPALIGTMIGAVYGGLISDWAIVWLSKRNNGIYEPEFRLYMCILPSIIGPAGIVLYGVGSVNVCLLSLCMGENTNKSP